MDEEEQQYTNEMVKTLQIEIAKLQKENEVLRRDKVGKRVKPEEVVGGKTYLYKDSGGTWWTGIGDMTGYSDEHPDGERVIIYTEEFGYYDPKDTLEIYELPE